MKSILVDTHAAIWYLLNSKKLSATAEETIDRAETICLCSISLIEIVFLTEKGKISPIALERLKSALTESNCRWQIISLDTSIALAIADIKREVVPEMPDRIISATAQYLNIPLVTRDTKIQALNIETIW